MNFKSLIITALVLMAVLAVPVAAEGMWNGDNWVDSHHNDACTDVVFNPQTGNTNCYNSNVGSKADIAADPNTYSGWADVIIRSHSNSLNPTLTLSNVLAPNVTKEIPVNADGLNTIPDLAPGEYILTLDNFNLPDETQKFTIAAGQMSGTQVPFIGQAYGAPVDHKVVYTILEATYGATREDCTTELIVGTGHSEWWYMMHGYTLQYRYRTGTESHHHCNWGPWSEWMNMFPRTASHGCFDFQTRWVKSVTTCTTYGQNLDVTQNVQHVVDLGYTSFFFFDNAQNPGGIFSQSGDLLSQINDPAYGIVKNVYIHYTRDGVDKVITTMEYESITL